MKAFAKIAAFGFGSAIGILVLGELINLSLAISARKLEPLCDGDFENMDCIEDDGFVTCYFSGPIKPI